MKPIHTEITYLDRVKKIKSEEQNIESGATMPCGMPGHVPGLPLLFFLIIFKKNNNKTNILREKTKKQRVPMHDRYHLSLSISLSLRPTVFSLSCRRVTAAPVHHRPDHRCPLSPSLHLAAPLLSISLSLAADSIRGY
jgi:hypothetical protein